MAKGTKMIRKNGRTSYLVDGKFASQSSYEAAKRRQTKATKPAAKPKAKPKGKSTSAMVKAKRGGGGAVTSKKTTTRRSSTTTSLYKKNPGALVDFIMPGLAALAVFFGVPLVAGFIDDKVIGKPGVSGLLKSAKERSSLYDALPLGMAAGVFFGVGYLVKDKTAILGARLGSIVFSALYIYRKWISPGLKKSTGMGAKVEAYLDLSGYVEAPAGTTAAQLNGYVNMNELAGMAGPVEEELQEQQVQARDVLSEGTVGGGKDAWASPFAN